MLVKWQKERQATTPALPTTLHAHPFTRFSIDFPGNSAPLRSLRHILADLTHLPLNAFKLIHAGAVMKDDAAPRNHTRLLPIPWADLLFGFF